MSEDWEELTQEVLDQYHRETLAMMPERNSDWRIPIGAMDPGRLNDPERKRTPGVKLTLLEKNFVYYWAKQKRLWIENHQQCRCWDQCPTCKLCRCTRSNQCFSNRHKYEHSLICLCGNGLKMIAPDVIRAVWSN